MNLAGLSMQHREWASFIVAAPEEPLAQVMIRSALAMTSTALAKEL
jgi:hypothetical protein